MATLDASFGHDFARMGQIYGGPYQKTCLTAFSAKTACPCKPLNLDHCYEAIQNWALAL